MLPTLADRLTRLWFAPTRGGSGPPAEAGPRVQEVTIEAEDGSALDAWWFPAEGEPRALVVLAHGNGVNLSHHWVVAKDLTPAGLDFVVFDYRGYGRSPGAASRRSALADVRSALEWAKGRALPHGRVVLLGQSMGGALALEAAAGRDDLAAVVVDSPFSSWSEIGAHHLTSARLAKRCAELPLRAALALTGRDPLQAAREIRAPLLVIAGADDDVCPPEMARAIAKAAGATLVEIEGSPHVGSRTPDQARRVRETMLEFIGRAVPAP
jgi:pimeloyl-ACP methyl ester carboxylesterase